MTDQSIQTPIDENQVPHFFLLAPIHRYPDLSYERGWWLFLCLALLQVISAILSLRLKSEF